MTLLLLQSAPQKPVVPQGNARIGERLEIAFDTDPFVATPVWTDVTEWWVRDERFEARYGRPTEREQFSAGTARFTLDNSDGRFDPTNTASPYFARSLATTLSSGITATASAITVPSSPTAPSSFPNEAFTVEIEGEQMLVTSGFGTTTWTVARGYNGTAAVPHDSGRTITWRTPGLLAGRRCRITGAWNQLSQTSASAEIGDPGDWNNGTAHLTTLPDPPGGDQYVLRVAGLAVISLTQIPEMAASAGDVVTVIASGHAPGLTLDGRIEIDWVGPSTTVASASTPIGVADENVAMVPITLTATAPAGTTGMVVRLEGQTVGLQMHDVRWDALGVFFTDVAPEWQPSVGRVTLFDGYIEAWPNQFRSPSYGTAEVDAVDATKALNLARLDTCPYAVEVAADSPDHWWRFNEGGDNPDLFADRTGNLHIGEGMSKGPSDGPPILAASADSTLSSNVSSTVTDFVWPYGSATAAIEFVHRYEESATGFADPLRLGYVFGVGPGVPFFIRVDFDAHTLSVRVNAENLFPWATVTISDYYPGVTHHIVLRRTSDTQFSIIIDHGDVGSGTVACPAGFGSAWHTGQVGPGFPDTPSMMGDLALYTSLSSTRAQAHYLAATTPWTGDTTDQRIARFLDLYGWPTDARELDAGSTILDTVQAFDGSSPLAEIHRTAEAEATAFHITPAGVARFRNRYALYLDERSAAPLYHFSDTGAVGTYDYDVEPVLGNDDELVVNESRVRRDHPDAGEAIAVNTTSRSRHGLRSVSRTLNLATEAEALHRAEWDVNTYGDPQPRIDSITIRPGVDQALWVPAMDLGVGDRIRVTHTPEGRNSLTLDAYIEGRTISDDDRSGWTFTYTLNTRDTIGVGLYDEALYDVDRYGY